MHSLAGLVCVVLLACVCSQPVQQHVYVNYNNLPGVGPVTVPDGYGSVDGMATITYKPWMVVYDFGPTQALTHYSLTFFNDTIRVDAAPAYTVRLLGIEYEAWNAARPDVWYVNCGSSGQKKTIQVTGSWPAASLPYNQTWGTTFCSGKTFSLTWGTNSNLGISMLHYGVIGNNPCTGGCTELGYDSNGNCGDNGVCSYAGPCTPVCSCNQGYYNLNGFCTEINNCATNNGGCDPAPAGVCFEDAPGQNSCGCADGYEGTPCADINECAVIPGNGGCGAHGVCVNSPGSYQCVCNTGYSGDGTFCSSNADCMGDCGNNAFCKQQVGGFFQCVCLSGFTGTPPSVPCVDINECNDPATCGPLGVCTNTPGSYSCNCGNANYTSGAPLGPCRDIDECGATPTICGDRTTTICHNRDNGYDCFCKSGYAMDSHNVCQDINECAVYGAGAICPSVRDCPTDPSVSSPIHCVAVTCTNLPGTYQCSNCPTGFARNATIFVDPVCYDIDECLSASCNNRSLVAGGCENTYGNFLCCGDVGFVGNSKSDCKGDFVQTGGGGITVKEGFINFSYAVAALIVVVACIIMFLLCRKRVQRNKHIQRRLRHAAMEEELEMSPRETNANGGGGDLLNQEGDLLGDDEQGNTDGSGMKHKRSSSQDLMSDMSHVKGSKHAHQSSSSASELANANPQGTREGDVYVGASPAENAEMGDENGIGPDGDYVLVVTPRNGASPTDSAVLIAPKIRVLNPDERSLEFKRAPAHAASAAASVLAVSASAGASPRIRPSQPLPQIQQPLAPMIVRVGGGVDGPIVPASPSAKKSLRVEEDPNETHVEEQEGPRGPRDQEPANLDVPEDPYGEHSQNSRHSNRPSQNAAMHINNGPIGEPQMELVDDAINPAAFDFDEDNGEPTMEASPLDKKTKKEMDKKKRLEEEKRRKQEKQAEEKRKKEAKAEEEKAKKEKKAAEKAEAERIKHDKQHAEKENAIRSAFAKLRQQDAAVGLAAGDEMAAEALREDEEPAETNPAEESPQHSPKEGGEGRSSPHHQQQHQQHQPAPSPAAVSVAPVAAVHSPLAVSAHSQHSGTFKFPKDGPAVAPVSVGSASIGNNSALNVRASPVSDKGHAKKHSNSHSMNANDYVAPSAMLSRGSHSMSANQAPAGPMSSAMAVVSPSDEPIKNAPPTLFRMTSEGMPRQRHSDSAQAARSLTLRDVLAGRNPRCLAAFTEFVNQEHASAALDFYKAVEEYRHQKAELEQKYLNEEPMQIAEDLAEKANDIFKLHLNPNAKGFLNLPEDVATRLAQRSWKYHKNGVAEAVLLPSADGVGYAVAAFVSTVFDESQEVVLKMMEADAWFRFMKTERAKEFES